MYKEQVRLNQAASSALMARLEAQKAICDGSEKELHKRFKEREELENQVRPEMDKARKRSRLLLDDDEEDDLLLDDRDRKLSLYLPGTSEDMSLHKELRVYFEEEHKAAAASEAETQKHGEIEEEEEEQKNPEVPEKSLVALEDNEKPDVEEGKRGSSRSFRAFPVFKERESEEDEESRRERGKGNVEKWLHILLEKNTKNDSQDLQNERSKNIDEMIEKLDHKFPLLEKVNEEDAETQLQEAKEANNNTSKVETRTESSRRSRMSFDLKNTPEKSGREKVVKRSESARAFRRIPSSPSLLLGMKKGIDCIRKKPVVPGHDDENDYLVKNNFIKSSLQTIKRAVKF